MKHKDFQMCKDRFQKIFLKMENKDILEVFLNEVIGRKVHVVKIMSPSEYEYCNTLGVIARDDNGKLMEIGINFNDYDES